MLFRNPHAFATLMLVAGLGLVAWFGEQRWRLPQWSEAEIEQSVELNLAIELGRRGPHLQPAGERLAALRATVRAEVEAEIRREREDLERWIGMGLVLIVLGTGPLLAARLRAR